MTDRDIIDGLMNNGNRDHLFRLIVDKFSERLYWHIRKMVVYHEDANDILQNTFIKAWRSLDSFRGESGLYTWLYRIATNESLTFLKRDTIKTFFSFTDSYKNVEDRLNADPYFSGDETQKLLYKAILSLPPKQRAVFKMRYFDDMKYEEISEVLNTSVGALKASYHHAYQKIQKIIEDSV